jgi:hypothetical protein
MTSNALQYLQHPIVDTQSPELASLNLSHHQRKDVAFRLVDSFDFTVGKSVTVYVRKGRSTQTSPVDASGARKIRSYLKASVDLDRSSLEQHFDNFSANEARHSFICDIIDHRLVLLRLYLEFQRDVVERSCSKPSYKIPETIPKSI